MSLPQLPIDQWPRSLTEEVAVLKQEPDDFEATGLLKFEEALDDLDYFKAAIVITDPTRPFALRRHRNCPVPGAGLIVVKASFSEMQNFIDEALSTLGIDRRSVTWLREE